jgi:2'-hydroxyisoflavone reductase
MRILVIGGTRFVGRSVVAAALARGHEVTLVHRGRTGGELFPQAEHRIADRDGDLSVLAQGRWDATIDVCAYLPSQVSSLAAALGGRGGHHVLISSVSAYAPPPGPGIREDAPLIELSDPTVTVVDGLTYGGLKVLCERAAAAAHRELTVVRPTYVVGPHDYTWRLPTWIARIARGGDVLCPGPTDSPMQVIDARDQADFVLGLLESGVGGTFHTASPRPPFSMADLLTTVAQVVAPPGTTLTWVDAEFVEEHALTAQEIPLWSGVDDDADVLAVDPSAAYDAGLRPRPLVDTVRDTHEWLAQVGLPDDCGLVAHRETALLAWWHAEHAAPPRA